MPVVATVVVCTVHSSSAGVVARVVVLASGSDQVMIRVVVVARVVES